MRISNTGGSRHSSKPHVALFLGSGFSTAFGLPTTTCLGKMLLDRPNGLHVVPEIEDFITERIADYWTKVFGWSDGSLEPALEDHFTQIDLAANSGHHLGATYGPKELRAIRRMTIHRVFSLLRSSGVQVKCVLNFFKALHKIFDVTIITTNWDAETEWSLDLLRIPYNYGVDEVTLNGRRAPREGIGVLKLHGSTTQGYCDTCRMLVKFEDEIDAAVGRKLLLEAGDFRLLGAPALTKQLERSRYYTEKRTCSCGGRIGARVGTFSYRKDLNPHAFYTIWDKAESTLQLARKWLFVGYSLPEADIEIRHMLKWTQLARKTSNEPSIQVVLHKDKIAAERYARFFGSGGPEVFQCGFEKWTRHHLKAFCK